MEQEPGIDFIVRGEGEETVVRLVAALERGQALEDGARDRVPRRHVAGSKAFGGAAALSHRSSAGDCPGAGDP